MTIITIFALFGDNLRLWLTTKDADLVFFIGFIISFVLFAVELFVNSCVLHDFKYSFFFWLDFIATLSLVPDIPMFLDLLRSSLGMRALKFDVDVFPGIQPTSSKGSNITKVLRSVRLIRLIRIIKLYNYA